MNFVSDNTILIREACFMDIEPMIKIRRACWINNYVNPDIGLTTEVLREINMLNDPQRDVWRERIMINRTRGVTFVATIEEKVVGLCMIRYKYDLKNHLIYFLYVDPDYQRRGIGTLLLLQSHSWFGKGSNIIAMVVAYNEHALSFYRKHGYKDSGHHEKRTVTYGLEMPFVKVVKENK